MEAQNSNKDSVAGVTPVGITKPQKINKDPADSVGTAKRQKSNKNPTDKVGETDTGDIKTAENEKPKAPNNPKNTKGKPKSRKKAKRRRKTPKQTFKFPIQDIHEMLCKGKNLKTVDPAVAVYITAVEEYVAHELVELAGNHAVGRHSYRIDVEDVIAAIEDDPELYQLVGEVLPEN